MLRRFFRTSFFVSFSRLLTTGTNLAVIYFISRFLGAGPLGMYGICFALMYLAYVVTSFSMEVYLSREVAIGKQNPKRLRDLLGDTVAVAVVGAALAVPLWWIAIQVYGDLPVELHGLAVACGFLLGLDLNLSGFLLGIEKAWIETGVNLVESLILLCPLAFFPHHIGLEGLFLLRLGSQMAGIGIKWVAIRSECGGERLRPRWGWFSEVRFFWFDQISSYFMRQADVLLLSLFVGHRELGAYFLTLRIFIAVGILAEVIARAAVPFMSRTFHGVEGIRMGVLLRRLLGAAVLLGAMMGIGLAVGGKYIIAIFKQAQVPGAIWLRWLSLAVPMRMGRSILTAFLSASRYQKSRFLVNLLNSCLFILFTIGLVIPFGESGALGARLLGETTGFLLLLLVVFFRLPESPGLRQTRS